MVNPRQETPGQAIKVLTFSEMFENGDFFPPFESSVHTLTAFWGSKNVTQSGDFCGRTKTEVFDDVIYPILLALRLLCKGCYNTSIISAFTFGQVKTIQISYV